MNSEKIELRLSELGKALRQLQEAIDKPDSTYGKTEIVIQRFEFTYELAWKTLRHVLEAYGHETASPRQAFTMAFAERWIDQDGVWIEIMEKRNLTSHTYNEKTVTAITKLVPEYAKEMQKLYESLITAYKKAKP